MPALSPRRFRTLAEANEYFAKSQSPAATKPVGPLPEKPPVFPAPETPPPKTVIDLNSIAPKFLAAHMEERTDRELEKFLREQPSDTPAYHAAYREICKRRKS